jgi:predicted DNA-binding transcriptional regulator YafY
MNRTDRLVSLVMLLQSRRVMTAAEMAAHFEITERTVYRDLAALGEGGVPIVGEPGVGYSLMRGYQLPPVMFTSEEAAALVTSGMLAEQMTDLSVRGPMRTALAKLTAILPTDQQQRAHRLRDAMAVQSQKPTSGVVPLSQVQAATADRQLLRLKYHGASRGHATEREVEPLGLVYYLQQWHLIAWCRLRDEVRDFRVDRIARCELLPEHLPKRADFDLKTFLSQQCFEGNASAVVIKVHPSLVESVQRNWGSTATNLGTEAEWVRFQLQTSSLEYMARWLVGLGNQVVVLEPAALVQQVIETAEATWRHHEKMSFQNRS